LLTKSELCRSGLKSLVDRDVSAIGSLLSAAKDIFDHLEGQRPV
jgi:hypothetical protein